jgi:hypothetical protein
LSYNKIGTTYGELGDPNKAFDYLQKSLAIRIRLFGDNHADVAESYSNIANTYGELGDRNQ